MGSAERARAYRPVPYRTCLPSEPRSTSSHLLTSTAKSRTQKPNTVPFILDWNSQPTSLSKTPDSRHCSRRGHFALAPPRRKRTTHVFARRAIRQLCSARTMEPVPETKRMEEFRSSPIPRVRLSEAFKCSATAEQNNQSRPSKPPNIRRSTEPGPLSPLSPGWTSPSQLSYRPRNTSPLSRGHARAHSTASALAPPLSRARSMPGVGSSGQTFLLPLQRPSSPIRSPGRVRASRRAVDDVFPGTPAPPAVPGRELSDIGEAATESPQSSESDSCPSDRSTSPIMGTGVGNTFSRRHRPSSPLRQLQQHNTATLLSTPGTVASSPSYQNTRFGELFPGTYSYPGSFASSSVPSTPTSARSRSPSISSLETIPDSPDAEEAALEAERIAQLKADADAADGDEAAMDAKGRNALDNTGARGRTLGLGFGSRDKRKRWSVCGAERRGDLDLETIWED